MEFAFGLVAAAAGLLFAAGHSVAGAIAFALCAGASPPGGRAMRKQGRGFYGQDKRPLEGTSLNGIDFALIDAVGKLRRLIITSRNTVSR